MSILLDAVTRNKQQEGVNVPDPVMTPRPNYQPQSDYFAGVAKLKWPMLFALALGLGVSLAWFTSQFNRAPVPYVGQSSEPVQQVIQAPVRAAEVHTQVDRISTAEPELAQEVASVRMAGKVALPMAKPYVASVNGGSRQLPREPQGLNAAQTTNGPAVEQVVNSSKSSGIIQASQGEPIILGANANQRGMDELAKLKREVEYAASDVGIKPPSQSANNLVAAFEAALRDVEASESQNREVTPDELNPIPRVATSDGVRKFGELPLSVQQQVPEFNINAHVYAGAPERRWLNVDGVELQQGDSIAAGLKIIEIRPRDVILEIQGESFKVPAI